MIAAIFEVMPANGRKDDYPAIVASLRNELERIDGFNSVERFQRLTDPSRLLSLSFWRDEEAATRWRNHAKHRAGQARGRACSSVRSLQFKPAISVTDQPFGRQRTYDGR